MYIGIRFYEGLKSVSDEDKTPIIIEIPQGATIDNISDILYKKCLIKDQLVFKLYAKKNNMVENLKAGTFELNKSMDVKEILTKLSKSYGTKGNIKVTIPEGYEIKQVAKKLSDEGLVSEEKFLELAGNKKNFESDYLFLKDLEEDQSLEGFLYPATYELNDNMTEEDIIGEMLKAFENIYEQSIKPKLKNKSLNLNQIITLASIIEREGKLDNERPLMSAVFYNRIQKGMPLQSCATVQYILGERKAALSTEDTRIDSPFNTYINKGLPPGPIASPGKVSIESAIDPADVDYLFFVLTGEDGSHTFTKTYEEHIKAKEGVKN